MIIKGTTQVYDYNFIRQCVDDDLVSDFINLFNTKYDNLKIVGIEVLIDFEDDTIFFYFSMFKNYMCLDEEDIEKIRKEWVNFVRSEFCDDLFIIDLEKVEIGDLGLTDLYSVIDLEKFYECINNKGGLDMEKKAQFKRIKKLITRRQKLDSEPNNIQNIEEEYIDKAVNLPMKNSSFVVTAIVRECKKKDIDDPKTDKWCVYSHDGKQLLGRYPTYEEALERLRQVEYFRLKNKKAAVEDDKIQELIEQLIDGAAFIYDAVVALRKARDIADEIGGEIARVVGGQLDLYTIPTLEDFYGEESLQTGNVGNLISFLENKEYEEE